MRSALVPLLLFVEAVTELVDTTLQYHIFGILEGCAPGSCLTCSGFSGMGGFYFLISFSRIMIQVSELDKKEICSVLNSFKDPIYISEMRSWCSRNILCISSFKFHLAEVADHISMHSKIYYSNISSPWFLKNGVICEGRASCHHLTGLDYFSGDNHCKAQTAIDSFLIIRAQHLLQSQAGLMQN